MGFCKHGLGGLGCVCCAIEDQTKTLMEELVKISNPPLQMQPGTVKDDARALAWLADSFRLECPDQAKLRTEAAAWIAKAEDTLRQEIRSGRALPPELARYIRMLYLHHYAYPPDIPDFE